MIARPTLVLIGGGTVIERSRVIAVINASSNSLPLKKYRSVMVEKGMLVDVTKGRRVKSLILTDSNHLFLSSVNAITIKSRLEEESDAIENLN